ncbi:hypothetical protein LI90_2961 [Carbonactinospora thermoautotrophica]|uniref:Uncharacterized protein n=1 Tax=Carbonactinospora thermoautotrophica TaxID=1469144 RepID=A0A132MW16_9ACTN|nr:hypothetical protein LI90_2961 [Carbonactinospora thermoautotrophica]
MPDDHRPGQRGSPKLWITRTSPAESDRFGNGNPHTATPHQPSARTRR